ncbi:MAG: NADH-quinone oxidoreductase [Sulfuricurvum sp. PC08-66]|nr:MAG: NADH-quinone oxidoreductase [Sulfuricurvum sp. PC08-66]
MQSSLLLASASVALIAIGVPLLLHLTKFLGPKPTHSTAKDAPYESGITHLVGDANERFSVKYYLVAIIFVLFDIEVVFMLPWAVNLRELGLFGIMEMFTFVGLLVAGLLYVYRKGALRWS